MIAHKFGGSSLANAERIAHVVDVLLARTGDGTQAVVVSAMQGVTDALLAPLSRWHAIDRDEEGKR